MDDLALVERMVRALAGGLSVPVTVKIRRFPCVKVGAPSRPREPPLAGRSRRLPAVVPRTGLSPRIGTPTHARVAGLVTRRGRRA